MLHFSICVCHPCAGAMLTFSVSFQLYWMIPEGNPLGSEQKRCLPCSSRHHQCHGWPFTTDIPLLAFFRPGSVPMSFIPQQCLLAAASHLLDSVGPRPAIKLDGNWSSFQLANSAPPLSVTDSAIASLIAPLPLPHLGPTQHIP